ncbi:MAG: MDR family MFS transporter [Haliangiales bacterium]
MIETETETKTETETGTETSPPATGTVPAAPSADAPLGRERLMLLVGIVIFLIFSVLDQTAVGTAMPRIVATLGGIEHYSWVFTSFMLASTVSLPIYASLSDTYGRRGLFLNGAAVFLIGSLLSGASVSMLMLVLCRAIQGVGAGALLALVPAIIGDIFPPAQRAKWHGAIAGITGVFVLGGPMLGGLITDYLGWRWIFYINLPVGIIGYVLAWRTLPRQTLETENPLDLKGALMLVATLVFLLLVLSMGGTRYPWASATILGLLAASAVFFALLFVTEKRAQKPILDFGLFRNTTYFVSITSVLLLAIALYGGTMYIPLFIQGVLGESATRSGTVLTPMLASFIVSAIVSTQVLSRTGRYRVLVVCMFALAATGMYLLAKMDAESTMGDATLYMFIAGLGMGGLTTVFTIIVQNALPHERMGEATGGVQFFRNIGGLVGIAALGAVVANLYGGEVASRLPAEVTATLSEEQIAELTSGMVAGGTTTMPSLAQLPAGTQPEILMAIRDGLSASLTTAFYLSVASLLLGLVIAALVRDIPLRTRNVQEPAIG